MAIILGKAKALKTILAGAGGFTLIELLVSLGLLTLATGMIGTALFQTHSIQRFWRDSVVATMELRNAGSTFAGDALRAEEVLLEAGGPALPCDAGNPKDSVTLVLRDGNGDRFVVYRIAGANPANLIRVDNGLMAIVARNIIPESVGFSLCNNNLTFDLELHADRDDTESFSLNTHIRKLD